MKVHNYSLLAAIYYLPLRIPASIHTSSFFCLPSEIPEGLREHLRHEEEEGPSLRGLQ
jgi:hypothetical protein